MSFFDDNDKEHELFNFWSEVKYILESSPSISSIIGAIEGSCSSPICPFLIIVIGSPFSPVEDQSFK